MDFEGNVSWLLLSLVNESCAPGESGRQQGAGEVTLVNDSLGDLLSPNNLKSVVIC